MALVWAEGFEIKCDTFDWTFYTMSGSDFSAPARSGSWAAPINSNSQSFKDLPGTYSEIYCQTAVYIKARGAATVPFFKWQSGSHILGTLCWSAPGHVLLAYTGDSSALVATGGLSVNLNTWYVIETHIKIDSSVGEITTRINGSQEFTFTGNTNPGGYNTLSRLFFTADGSLSYNLDDIVVNDTTGSTNHSWPNQMHLIYLRPSAVGSLSQMTPSVGTTNYLCVDEINFPDTSDYVTGTAGQIDSYTLANLPSGITTISFVQPMCYAHKNSFNAPSTMQMGVLSAGVTTLGNPCILSRGFNPTFFSAIETNPVTSSQWVRSDFTNMQLVLQLGD